MAHIKCCADCGSENVVLDAWASWDFTKQDWALATTFDAEFCRDCERSTTIVNVETAGA